MAIQMSGVFTGIDTDTLVSRVMAIGARPVALLEVRKEEYESQQTAVQDIESRLSQFKSLVDDLRDAAALREVSATSGDQEVLRATVGEGASEGFHSITINQMAQSARRVHDGVEALDTLVGAGAFVYTHDGVTRTIQATEDTTLEDLASLINNDASNPGVVASVLEYDAGGSEVFHLVLAGKQSGSDYGITVEAETTLSGFAAADFAETQTAQDAQVRVDGYPAGDWIERSGNVITDVIPGVSLRLQSAGTTTLTLTKSTDGLKTDLQNLISVYNGLADKIDQYTGYDEDEQSGGVLQGDATINSVLSTLRRPLTGTVDGFLDGSDAFALASHFGIELNDEYRFELDASTFNDAVDTDYDAVLALIGAASSGTTDSDYIQFDTAGDTTDAGTYEVQVSFGPTGSVTQAQIRRVGETAWRNLNFDGNTLTGQIGTDEEGLKLTAVWDGVSGTQTADVRVRRGFAGTLYNAVESMLSSTGLIEGRKDQIQEQIDALDANIERQTARLEAQEERLRAQYARMEATLAKLESQQSAIDAMVQSLEANRASSSGGSSN